MNYKRDDKGRPVKPPTIGPAWELTDLFDLLEALLTIAQTTHPSEALEMLDHGYVTSSLSAGQYDYIKSMILQSQVGKK